METEFELGKQVAHNCHLPKGREKLRWKCLEYGNSQFSLQFSGMVPQQKKYSYIDEQFVPLLTNSTF